MIQNNLTNFGNCKMYFVEMKFILLLYFIIVEIFKFILIF